MDVRRSYAACGRCGLESFGRAVVKVRRNQPRNEHLEKGEKMDGRLWLALVRVEHGAGPIAGLAIPVFQCVKALQDGTKLV